MSPGIVTQKISCSYLMRINHVRNASTLKSVPQPERPIRQGSSCPPTAALRQRRPVRSTNASSENFSTEPLSSGDKLRAIVIGAGMAGMTAAQALCQQFDEVVLLEKDPVDAETAPGVAAARGEQLVGKHRPGVAQFAHPHLLLVRGLQILEELFGSGIVGSMRQAGAVSLNWITDIDFHNFGVASTWHEIPGQDGTAQADGVCCTRSLTEGLVRQEITRRNSNLRFLSGTQAEGLLFSADSACVTGLQLADGSSLAADLVVDASGRNSKTGAWLAAAGRDAPPEEFVKSGCVYVARYWELLPGQQDDIRCDVTFPKLPATQSGIMWQVEGGRFQSILFGYNDQQPPADDEGCLEFARNLPASGIYERMVKMRPISPLLRFKRTDNYRRRYDQIQMPDSGLVVLGDAACTFNPIYAQGMTIGLMGSAALRDCLAARLASIPAADAAARRSTLRGLPQEFQAKHAELVTMPWQMATGEDARRNGHAADATTMSLVPRLINAYMEYLRLVAMTSTNVELVFWRVMHLTGSPSEVFTPKIIAAVVMFWLRSKLAQLGGSISSTMPFANKVSSQQPPISLQR